MILKLDNVTRITDDKEKAAALIAKGYELIPQREHAPNTAPAKAPKQATAARKPRGRKPAAAPEAEADK